MKRLMGAVLLCALSMPALAQEATDSSATNFVKIGPGVTPPQLVKKKNPKYTRQAREADLQGLVMVEADIGTDGNVQAARVLRPLGMGLDERAVEAVKKWKFKPAMKDGKPVPVQIAVEVLFRQAPR